MPTVGQFKGTPNYDYAGLAIPVRSTNQICQLVVTVHEHPNYFEFPAHIAEFPNGFDGAIIIRDTAETIVAVFAPKQWVSVTAERFCNKPEPHTDPTTIPHAFEQCVNTTICALHNRSAREKAT